MQTYFLTPLVFLDEPTESPADDPQPTPTLSSPNMMPVSEGAPVTSPTFDVTPVAPTQVDVPAPTLMPATIMPPVSSPTFDVTPIASPASEESPTIEGGPPNGKPSPTVMNPTFDVTPVAAPSVVSPIMAPDAAQAPDMGVPGGPSLEVTPTIAPGDGTPTTIPGNDSPPPAQETVPTGNIEGPGDSSELPTMITSTEDPTQSPTPQPTADPTVAPVTPAPTPNPTSTPTLSPTTQMPSTLPSSTPTIDFIGSGDEVSFTPVSFGECSAVDGVFGTITEFSVFVAFRYEVVVPPGTTLLQQLATMLSLETEKVNHLLETLFPDECGSDTPGNVDPLEIVGISDRPRDSILRQNICETRVVPENECFVVDGEVTLFVTSDDLVTREEELVQELIEQAMQDDVFVSPERGILQVVYIRSRQAVIPEFQRSGVASNGDNGQSTQISKNSDWGNAITIGLASASIVISMLLVGVFFIHRPRLRQDNESLLRSTSI